MSTEEEHPMSLKEYEQELGRRLAAAYLSWALGTTFNFQYEKHLKGRQVGEFWLQAARHIAQQMAELRMRRAEEHEAQKEET